MNNQKIYVFGKKQNADWLTAETVKELIEEAFEKAAVAARPDISCIIEILDRVGKCWADPEYHLRKKAAKLLPGLTMFSEAMINEGFNVISSICSRSSLEKKNSRRNGLSCSS